ncbi:Uncharacterised protein [Candidatus Anstonella stagnisolia]|nr:Uncharacterised protein [Candidatus Anstonella stagnisolia]
MQHTQLVLRTCIQQGKAFPSRDVLGAVECRNQTICNYKMGRGKETLCAQAVQTEGLMREKNGK